MAELRTYNAKSDFSKTPEPRGAAAKAKGNQFVIQKHAATRLHYDLRLELDGVMLSWAVPKGPSYDPAEKRMAVRTEDHPISYNSFDGKLVFALQGHKLAGLWELVRIAKPGDRQVAWLLFKKRDGLQRAKADYDV